MITPYHTTFRRKNKEASPKIVFEEAERSVVFDLDDVDLAGLEARRAQHRLRHTRYVRFRKPLHRRQKNEHCQKDDKFDISIIQKGLQSAAMKMPKV